MSKKAQQGQWTLDIVQLDIKAFGGRLTEAIISESDVLAVMTEKGLEHSSLIAAAPDLLLALEEAAMALDLAGLVLVPKGEPEPYWKQQARAAALHSRASIAKAKGAA